MSTFEAYFALGAISIAVSAIGAGLRVESKEAPVTMPTAVLTVLVPQDSDTWNDLRLDPRWNDDEDANGLERDSEE